MGWRINGCDTQPFSGDVDARVKLGAGRVAADASPAVPICPGVGTVGAAGKGAGEATARVAHADKPVQGIAVPPDADHEIAVPRDAFPLVAPNQAKQSTGGHHPTTIGEVLVPQETFDSPTRLRQCSRMTPEDVVALAVRGR